VYAGLCLDNGLMVTTNKRKRYVALCRIIERIINATLLGERTLAEMYPDHPYKSFKNVEKGWLPKYKRQFANRMKNALSLNEYVDIRDKIKPLWEKDIFDPEENNEIPLKTVVSLKIQRFFAFWAFMKILFHSAPILYDCKEMKLALEISKKDPGLCSVSNIKYRRI